MDFTQKTVRELLGVYAGVLDELIRRGLVRTRNAPLGDLMEHVVWRAYGGQLMPNSVKSYDVITAAGTKIQVKARSAGIARRSSVFSAIRSWDFQLAVFVVLDPKTNEIRWARELTQLEAEQLSRRREHTNSSAIRVASVEEMGRDVTAEIKRAFRAIDPAPNP